MTTVEDLESELADVCGVLNQSHARLVELVADALTAESWAADGIRSPEHWLTLRAGLSPARARQLVAVARRRSELPAVMEAFGDGRLSVDQVAVVARHTPARVEESVAELAVNASVPQLQRTLSRYSFDPAPEDQDEGAPQGDPPSPEQRAAAPAELTMGLADGRFTLRFEAPADLGVLVEAALKEAKDALFQARRPHVSLADALVEVAARSMGAVRSINRRDAFRVYVHLDTHGGWLGGRPALPPHLTDKLTCDGVLQPVWVTGGSPVNVGRAQRIVPDRTRRMTNDRDGGRCRFPACTATTALECHHIIPRSHGDCPPSPNTVQLELHLCYSAVRAEGGVGQAGE